MSIRHDVTFYECDRSNCSSYEAVVGRPWEFDHPPEHWLAVYEGGGRQKVFCSVQCLYDYAGDRLGGPWDRTDKELVHGDDQHPA